MMTMVTSLNEKKDQKIDFNNFMMRHNDNLTCYFVIMGRLITSQMSIMQFSSIEDVE